MPAPAAAEFKRFTRRQARIIVAVVAGALVLLAIGSPGGATTTATTGPLAGTGVFRFGNSYPNGSGYDRYGYVDVGVANAAAAGALDTTSLVYTSGTSIPANYTDGVSYAQALANNWLLKDANGNYVMNAGYGKYVGDFGSPGYQQAFLAWALDFLAANHDRGVEIDDTICDAAQLTGGVYPVKYPNQQAWEDAQVSFISTVGDSLKAHGYYVMVNATCKIRGNPAGNSGALTAAFWQRLAPHVSGLCSEYWQQLPSNPSVLRLEGTDDWTHFWDGWESLIDVAQNAGADFFAAMYGSSTDTNIMRYGKASFLLDWNGNGGALLWLSDNGQSDPWNLEWTMDIGVPAGPRYQVGAGWRRDYTDGTVLLNPDQTTVQLFTLGGTYFTADGTAVDSVTLSPGEAIVLQGPGTSLATPPPTLKPPPAPPSPAPVSAPQAAAEPTIAGDPRVGETLTGGPGTWSGAPESYTFTWQRCKTKRGALKCKDLRGANGSTYVPTKHEKGWQLRVLVTATNSAGAGSATSDLTAAVTR